MTVPQYADPERARGLRFGRWHDSVRGLPEVFGEAALADAIETPGSGQVRALLTVAGNPALSL